MTVSIISGFLRLQSEKPTILFVFGLLLLQFAPALFGFGQFGGDDFQFVVETHGFLGIGGLQ